jgi:hypothetical protein
VSFASPFTPPYANPDTTGKVVENQVAFSSYTINNANEFLGSLQSSLQENSITVSAGDLANPDFAIATLGQVNTLLQVLGNVFPIRPALSAISGNPPTAPDPSFTPAPDVVIPTLTAVAPALNIPSAPSSALPSVPAQPSLEDIALPTAPTYALPAVPTITAVELPQPPTITLPLFSSTLPIDTLVVPTNTFSWYETAYQSSLLDATTAKLLADIQNGGYGIDATDEASLWDRERGRQLENTNAAVEEIFRQGASRGFPLPPGDLNVAVQRAQQDLSDKLNAVSRDIALKRADMYVENRKFTIQEARSLETVLIGYYSSRMERSLNAAKAVLELGIAVFNASVAKYNAQLDAYKTEAQVFESKIRAALAQVEIYRTTMEGKRLELETQKQQVEIYRAQLAGVDALIQIYKTSVEAQVQRVNVQRLKVESFRASIDAYAAQVQAKVSEAQMFEARVRGEVARVNAFEAEVRAYASQVDASKVRSETLLGNLRAQTEQANAQARIYEAKIAGYRADVDKQVEFVKAQLSEFQTDATVYGTRAQVYGDAARVAISQATVEANMRAKAIETVIENARTQLRALEKSADIKVEGERIVGGYITSAVAASIGALNTISAITKQT